MRLIDADTLESYGLSRFFDDYAFDIIDKMPTINAVEVVGLRNLTDEELKHYYDSIYKKAITIINVFSNAEAVEVVRCRDCAFSRDTGDYQDTYYCDHPTHNKMHLVHSRDFCSEGRTK